MARTSALGAAITLIVVVTPIPSLGWATENTWTDARATFYGRDGWPLHIGSCEYYFICPKRWTDNLQSGYDVTAVTDRSDLYGHCGECLEIKCRSAVIKDGFGETLDRTNVCLNDKSVKVKITDTCPCNYPDNAESNRRWCCNDYPHLDVSQWALEKIVQDTTKWGVFAIQYRKIDCSLDLGPQEAPAVTDDPASLDPHLDLKPASLDCAHVAAVYERKRRTSSRISRRRSAQSRREGGYWQQWWDNFRQYADVDTRKKVYRMIWDRIHAGELTPSGHGRDN